MRQATGARSALLVEIEAWQRDGGTSEDDKPPRVGVFAGGAFDAAPRGWVLRPEFRGGLYVRDTARPAIGIGTRYGRRYGVSFSIDWIPETERGWKSIARYGGFISF